MLSIEVFDDDIADFNYCENINLLLISGNE